MAADPGRIGVVVATHGKLGEELLRVTRYILGKELDTFRAVAIPFMDEMRPAPAGEHPFADRRERLRAALLTAVMAVDRGDGVLILTDLLGGTSSNVAQEVLVGRKGVVVAGVNLPMLLKAASLDRVPVAAAAEDLLQRSRNAIQLLPEKTG